MNRKEWLENLINKNNFTIGAEVGVQGGKTFKYLIKQMPDLKLYGIDISKYAKDNSRFVRRSGSGSRVHA